VFLVKFITKRECYVPGFKRGPGRPRANWIGTVKKDLQVKDGAHLGRSRGGSSWQTRMASECGQCIHLDAGWIKVKVKECYVVLVLCRLFVNNVGQTSTDRHTNTVSLKLVCWPRSRLTRGQSRGQLSTVARPNYEWRQRWTETKKIYCEQSTASC